MPVFGDLTAWQLGKLATLLVYNKVGDLSTTFFKNFKKICGNFLGLKRATVKARPFAF